MAFWVRVANGGRERGKHGSLGMALPHLLAAAVSLIIELSEIRMCGLNRYFVIHFPWVTCHEQ